MSSNGHHPPTGELVAELHHRFASSEYGKILKNNTRWSLYQPEHVSNEEWERMFGADVNNLDHLPLTASLVDGFVRGCREPHVGWTGPVPEAAQFSNQEARVMKVTGITHDWGEAGKVGDVMWHLKTEDDEIQEALDLKDIILDLVPEYRWLPELRQVAEILADKKCETKLGKAFNTIERMGYMRTSLRASKLRGTVDDLELDGSFAFMSHQPFCDHVPVLLERAKTYPAVAEFLRDHKAELLDVADWYYAPNQPGLSALYEKFTREDDNRRKTFDRTFQETAGQLDEYYAVDVTPVAA